MDRIIQNKEGRVLRDRRGVKSYLLMLPTSDFFIYSFYFILLPVGIIVIQLFIFLFIYLFIYFLNLRLHNSLLN